MAMACTALMCVSTIAGCGNTANGGMAGAGTEDPVQAYSTAGMSAWNPGEADLRLPTGLIPVS